jgi:hypothetical protein
MSQHLYPAAFWLLWIGIPSAAAWYVYGGRRRVLITAAATVVVPFLTIVGLALAASPGPAELEAWETFSVDLGAPAGYLAGIALTFSLFRRRDRARRTNSEPRSCDLPGGEPSHATT